MSKHSLEDQLDAVYQSGGDRHRQDAVYDQWARDYDRDLWASGNPYIALMAGMVGRHVPNREARILDAGCGTGNMAQLLAAIGYKNIVGIDASQGMLDLAKTKGCYREVHQILLGSDIGLDPDSFDVITAAGVLTHGHAESDSLDGLLRLAKPGAPIIFSISKPAMEDCGFSDKIKTLENSGAWILKDQSDQFRTYPFSEQYKDLRHWIFVYYKV
jgi:2-polyprenyl-3-methyl-5-hydroxy-6-metoxy-1,4-benzoquinol methylase